MSLLTPIKWENNELLIIDQTLLPEQCRWIKLKKLDDVIKAIQTLQVRGAPAIGVCAAFGVVVAVLENLSCSSLTEAKHTANQAIQKLATTRPTAYNLFWALKKMETVIKKEHRTTENFYNDLLQEALHIQTDDTARCRKIGDFGVNLIQNGCGILTHCNAGALATSSYGTALAPLYRAKELGKEFHVYVDETRPLLQGARLTAWELQKANIEVTVICDNAAAYLMQKGNVQLVIVGADRIAINGDTANKIGTYSLAINARYHNIPFYIAAPFSTIDMKIPNGKFIPIEIRDGEELTLGFSKKIIPENVKTFNPAFDLTPAELITGIITEYGILTAPFEKSILEIAKNQNEPNT